MEFGLEKLSHFGFEIRALFSQREEKLVPVWEWKPCFLVGTQERGGQGPQWEAREREEECPLEQGGGGGLAGRGSQGPAPWGGEGQGAAEQSSSGFSLYVLWGNPTVCSSQLRTFVLCSRHPGEWRQEQ